MTAIKFCGLKDREAVDWAASLGVDAVGFVLYSKSPRAVTLHQLRALQSCIPPFMTRVGLLVDPEIDTVRRLIDEHLVDVLQFHGKESGEFCESFRFPYLRAVPATLEIRQEWFWSQSLLEYPSARAFLLDTPHPTLQGGTGKVFDWSNWPSRVDRPLILAGGLNAENVADAIARVKPYAVDVSGGIELNRGVKCRKRMSAFVAAVRGLS